MDDGHHGDESILTARESVKLRNCEEFVYLD